MSGRRRGNIISSVPPGAAMSSSADTCRTMPPSANGSKRASNVILPASSHDARPMDPALQAVEIDVHLRIEDAHRRPGQIALAVGVALDDEPSARRDDING